jgi:hypothetical protein
MRRRQGRRHLERFAMAAEAQFKPAAFADTLDADSKLAGILQRIRDITGEEAQAVV